MKQDDRNITHCPKLRNLSPISSGMPSIRVTNWFGRLGNNCMQLAHAVYLAQELGIRFVVHPPHTMFRTQVIDLEKSFGCHAGLSGEFFYAKTVHPHALPMSFCHRKRIFLDVLFPRLNCKDILDLPAKQHLKQDTTLVIHIRSGDVFSAKPHGRYVQPPLWYYRVVIESTDWSSIILVCEDRLNPVINQLCIDYPAIRLHQSTLEEDFAILYNARNLVGSYGTFTHAAFCFNPDILRYWIPGFLADSADFAIAFPQQITAIHCPGYIEVGNWKNTFDQRKIMLDYRPFVSTINGELS